MLTRDELMQSLTVHEIAQILSPLRPREFGDYVRITCPACSNDRAFYYTYRRNRSLKIGCNRRNECRPTSIITYLQREWATDENGVFDGIAKRVGRQIVQSYGLLENTMPDSTRQKSVIATYNYFSKDGDLLFFKERYEPKGFGLFRVSSDGCSVPGISGIEKPLYRVLELEASRKSEFVFLPEGEKDADNIADLGLIATTNACGAEHWEPQYTQCLKDRHVVILQDDDDAGDRRTKMLVKHLLPATASLRAIRFYNHDPKVVGEKDVSDWILSGGTMEMLLDLVKSARAINVAEPTGAGVDFTAKKEIVRIDGEPTEYGFFTGLKNLDQFTQDLDHGSLIVVGARTGLGKTSIGIRMMDETMKRGNVGIMFSQEMSSVQIVRRMVAQRSRISTRRIRSLDLNEEERANVKQSLEEICQFPMWIESAGGLTSEDVQTKVREVMAHKSERLGVVVVDYLQIMSAKGSYEQRTREIGKIVSDMKALAKEYGTTVILLSQLNRLADHEPPSMSHLADSAAIEATADLVTLLYKTKDWNPSAFTKDVRVIIAKNRDGEVGETHLRFIGEYCQFADPSPRTDEPAEVPKFKTSHPCAIPAAQSHYVPKQNPIDIPKPQEPEVEPLWMEAERQRQAQVELPYDEDENQDKYVVGDTF